MEFLLIFPIIFIDSCFSQKILALKVDKPKDDKIITAIDANTSSLNKCRTNINSQ